MVAVLLTVTGVNGLQFELKMDCVDKHGIVYTMPFRSSLEVLHGILGESTSNFGSYVGITCCGCESLVWKMKYSYTSYIFF